MTTLAPATPTATTGGVQNGAQNSAGAPIFFSLIRISRNKPPARAINSAVFPSIGALITRTTVRFS
jgi:hypothetical protein